jgi:hypothetical protein
VQASGKGAGSAVSHGRLRTLLVAAHLARFSMAAVSECAPSHRFPRLCTCRPSSKVQIDLASIPSALAWIMSLSGFRLLMILDQPPRCLGVGMKAEEVAARSPARAAGHPPRLWGQERHPLG